MPSAPLRPSPHKEAILQAVYEDNRGLGPRPARPPRRAAPQPARRRWGAAGLAGLLAVVAVAVAWGVGVTRMPPASAGPVSTDVPEPIGQVFPAPEGFIVGPEPDVRSAGGEAGMADLLNLQVRTIVIDPGHGGRDPGAVGPGRLEEKAVALDVAHRLRARLARHGALDVLLTRDGDDAISNEDRVTFANGAGADLFVSIHVNALPDTALAPVETYFFAVEADEAARALARAENAGSTFSVAEFNAVLRRAGTAVKLEESRALAESVQQALLQERAIRHRAAPDWGAKPAPFTVLLHTEAPAILAEITALSNPTEEARLRTPAYRDAIAAALESGILAYLRLPSPSLDD